MGHIRSATLLALVLASGAGCGLLPPLAEAPPECGFPDGTALAFAGVATPDELGLESFSATARGWLYVTAAPVPRLRAGGGEDRMACRPWSWAGGPPEMIPVPPDWVPPPRP